MKTIGTCNECKWWQNPVEAYPCPIGTCKKVERRGDDEATDWLLMESEDFVTTAPDFGCVHWECRQTTDADIVSNYKRTTDESRKIEDLQRENDAAFEKIQELSRALVKLGYDPTAKR